MKKKIISAFFFLLDANFFFIVINFTIVEVVTLCNGNKMPDMSMLIVLATNN